MPYCSENQVYDASGLTSAKVQTITGKTEAQVTTLVSSYITWAERAIKDWVRLPIVVRRELHLGDGEKFEFDLGPHDEDYSIDYDPLNDVDSVYAVYFEGKRKKLPYPKDDCDLGCENESSDWATSNVTLTDETTTIACGAYSLKGVFSATGYMRYPSTLDLNKNIDIYDWVGFRFRTNDATKTFTVKLYDRSGNANTYDFTVHQADVWYLIMIKVDDFNGSIIWEDEYLYYLDFYANGACTVYVDNLNFNDEVMWTIPQGTFVTMTKQRPIYSDHEGGPADGYEIHVTYSFDPFNTTVPSNIEEACACLAGVKLFDHLLGLRAQDVGFVLQADEGTVSLDRFTMEITRRRLLNRAKGLVALYGFGFDTGLA